MAVIKHYQHHYHFTYTTSFKRHFWSNIGVLVFFLCLALWAFAFIAPHGSTQSGTISLLDLLSASAATLFRLIIAYVLGLIFSIPLALLITSKESLERILLPIFDIVQSVPVLAFFPLIVLVFIKLGFYDGAAIFVLFTGMLWNLVFSMVGGIKTVPADIKDAALVFKIRGLKKLRYITLPAILPYIITGSLLAWGQGWSIIIVAEVLHNYIPHGTSSQDLYGLGSLLVNASYQGQGIIFMSALAVMILIIGALNFFIWQKLLHLTERYKFD